MTSATESEQEQIKNDVKIYYKVIKTMVEKGELTDDQARTRIMTSEMYSTVRLINDTIDYIGENSTTIIAYDVIIECLDEILNLL